MSDHYNEGQARRLVAGEEFFAATGENWLGRVVRQASQTVDTWPPYKRQTMDHEQQRANSNE